MLRSNRLGHFSHRTNSAIIAIAAILAGIYLAGCGRKAGLDPPPASSITDERAAGPQAAAPPGLRPDGQPVEVTQLPPRAGTPLDWLIE
jgi:predicted small lipoprotein YifL